MRVWGMDLSCASWQMLGTAMVNYIVHNAYARSSCYGALAARMKKRLLISWENVELLEHVDSLRPGPVFCAR